MNLSAVWMCCRLYVKETWQLTQAAEVSESPICIVNLEDKTYSDPIALVSVSISKQYYRYLDCSAHSDDNFPFLATFDKTDDFL